MINISRDELRNGFCRATLSLILVGVTTFSLTMPVFGQQRILVGQNVQVSKAHADREHVEVLLAADPNNPLRLLGCAIVRWGEKGIRNKTIAYASLDGGKNWEPVLDGSPDPSMTDPACTYGPDSAAFFVAQGRAKAFVNTGSSVAEKFFGFLYRSRDGGKTWLPPNKYGLVPTSGCRPKKDPDGQSGAVQTLA